MTDTEKINELTNRIIQNQRLECEWNDKMSVMDDEAEFEHIVINRSKVIRELYQDNMDIIHQLEVYMENLNDERARALFETARGLHLNGRIDQALLCKIADPVLKYFKEHNIEEENTIILSAIRFADAQDYYNLMDASFQLEENLENAKWVIKYKDHYLDYEDLRIRRNILHMYSGIILAYLRVDERKYYPDIMKNLEEARELSSREDILKLESGDPTFEAIVENFKFWLPWEIGTAPHRKEYFEPMLKMCDEFRKEELHEDVWNEKILSDLITARKKIHLGETSLQETLQQHMNLIKTLPKPDWDNAIALSQGVVQCFALIYIDIMRLMADSEMSFSDREDYINKISLEMDQLFAEIPYHYDNSYISSICIGLFTEALPNVRSSELIDTLISKLMLQRQPSTLFHSVMVGEISVLIAEKILEKEPELFASIPNYRSEKEVLEKKEELLCTIRRAAQLHDLGKCAISPVIMQQSRKIYDEEFGFIKTHPVQGEYYLSKLEGYELYRAVTLGHHKTYDGKGGYPESFDNTASEYRFLIDLISVSDSIDAATDITGRNYTAGKDFPTLLTELEQSAGTRYNPDIVRILSESQELKERLTTLTGKGRIAHLYEVYKSL